MIRKKKLEVGLLPLLERCFPVITNASAVLLLFCVQVALYSVERCVSRSSD